MQIRMEEIRERARASRQGIEFDARETLAAITRPRLSTSAGHEEALAEVRWRFERLGYEAGEMPFTFAPWAGRFALPIVAGTYLFGVVVSGILLLAGVPGAALVVLLLTGGASLAIALNVTRALHEAPWGRKTGVNVLFRRADVRPRYILMAHLDTKSQLVPLSLRAPAIGLAAASWLVLLGIAAASLVRPVEGGAVFFVAIVAVLSGMVLVLAWADNESPGALDNASGVATLLGVAEREREAGDVAFLITDAEELGLAGARTAAAALPAVHGVINIDGVDDVGPFLIMERFGVRRRGLAPHLAVGLLSAASALDLPVRRRDTPLGLMLDHMPLVDAGIPSLTLMRGDLRSLHRVHRPSDDLAHLRGTGVVHAIDLVCAALGVVRTHEPRA